MSQSQAIRTSDLKLLCLPSIFPGVIGDTKSKFCVNVIALLKNGEPQAFYMHKDGLWYDKAVSGRDKYAGYFDSAEAANEALNASAAEQDRLHPCFVAEGRTIWDVCRDVAAWQASPPLPA